MLLLLQQKEILSKDSTGKNTAGVGSHDVRILLLKNSFCVYTSLYMCVYVYATLLIKGLYKTSLIGFIKKWLK